MTKHLTAKSAEEYLEVTQRLLLLLCVNFASFAVNKFSEIKQKILPLFFCPPYFY